MLRQIFLGLPAQGPVNQHVEGALSGITVQRAAAIGCELKLLRHADLELMLRVAIQRQI